MHGTFYHHLLEVFYAQRPPHVITTDYAARFLLSLRIESVPAPEEEEFLQLECRWI